MDAWAQAHRSELIRDIARLIAIPSVTGTPACADAAHELLALGQAYGLQGAQHGGLSVSLMLPGDPGTGELGILGHLDVVPEGQGWRYAPFKAVEKDGYLIGRGSSDNKGPVVMSLFVLRCLRELGVTLKSNVRLIAGLQEETDMQDVIHYLQSHEPPAFTLNCDGAWAGCIGEKGILEADLVLPAGGNLISLSGGSAANMVPDRACAILAGIDENALMRARALCPGLQAEETPHGTALFVQGRAAHCCVPHQGDNAILRLIRLLCDAELATGDAFASLDALGQCFPDDSGCGLRIHHTDALSGRMTCVASLLSMENGMIRLHFNARTALSQRYEWILPALEKRLAGFRIRLENIRWLPPRYTDPAQPEAALLLDTCRTYLDRRAKPYVTGGGTHSRFFPRSLPFGPEVLDPRIKRPLGKAHEPDEAVCINDLLRAMKVYVIALKRLDEHFHP